MKQYCSTVEMAVFTYLIFIFSDCSTWYVNLENFFIILFSCVISLGVSENYHSVIKERILTFCMPSKGCETVLVCIFQQKDLEKCPGKALFCTTVLKGIMQLWGIFSAKAWTMKIAWVCWCMNSLETVVWALKKDWR